MSGANMQPRSMTPSRQPIGMDYRPAIGGWHIQPWSGRRDPAGSAQEIHDARAPLSPTTLSTRPEMSLAAGHLSP